MEGEGISLSVGSTTKDIKDPASQASQTAPSTSKTMTDVPMVSPCGVDAFELPSPSTEVLEMLKEGDGPVDENPLQLFVNLFSPKVKTPRSNLNKISRAPQMDDASVHDVVKGENSALENNVTFLGPKAVLFVEKIPNDVAVEPDFERINENEETQHNPLEQVAHPSTPSRKNIFEESKSVSKEDKIATPGGTKHNKNMAEHEELNPWQQISNLFSPKPERSSGDRQNDMSPPHEDFFKELHEGSARKAETTGNKVEEVNIFDHLREMVTAFTPQRPDMKESPRLTPFSSTEQLDTPMSEQSRRLDFESELREVASVHDLYVDAKKGLTQIFDSAKQVDTKEWIEKACQVNAKDFAGHVQKQANEFVAKTQRTKKSLIDSAKEVEPQQVLRTARKSADEVVQSVKANAKSHPYQWVVIAAVSFMIFVNMLFFSGSVGSTTMQQNKISIKVHQHSTIPGASRKPEEIVRGVVDFLKQEMGANQVDQVIDKAATSWRSDSGFIENGREIVERVSELLQQPEDSNDFVGILVEKFNFLRKNPRKPLDTVARKSKDLFLDAKDRLSSDEVIAL